MAKLLNEPGHGANTWPPSKGTRASGGVPEMAEHDFNAAVADETNRLLSGKLTTYSAQPSRGKDVSLTTRTRLYNEEFRKDKSAIGFSHHGNANANKATKGFGVFYWGGSATGKKLAQMLLAAYKKEFPGYPIWGSGIFESKRGDWTNFAILRDTSAPFVLIEWDFFTNDDARKRMLSTDYRKRCGKVAASVACDWYGIPFTDFAAAKPAPSTERDYLLKGDTGAAVKTLQTGLKQAGYKVSVDGIWGKETELAVDAFQRSNSLLVDRIWGKASQAKLNAILANLNKKPVVKPAAPSKPAAPKKEEVEAIVKKVHETLVEELELAKKAGITDGSKPTDYATRAETAVMVYRGVELAVEKVMKKIAK